MTIAERSIRLGPTFRDNGRDRQSQINVLLVEDSLSQASSIQAILNQPAGVTLHLECVDRIEAAIRAVGEGQIDVVLLDICMPRMNGVEACRGMKCEDPDLPVVLYSAEPLEVELAHEQQVADLCVAKDRLFDGLTDWIRNTFAIGAPDS